MLILENMKKKIIKESKFYVLLLSQVIPTDIFMWLFLFM